MAHQGPVIHQHEKNSIDRTFPISVFKDPAQKTSVQPSPTFIIKEAGNTSIKLLDNQMITMRSSFSFSLTADFYEGLTLIAISCGI